MLVKLAVVLFVVAEVVILAMVGTDAWPLVAGWGAAGLALGLLAHLVRAPLARVLACAALLPLCVLLTFEGGLFFVPAVVVLLLAALMDRRAGGRDTARGLGGS